MRTSTTNSSQHLHPITHHPHFRHFLASCKNDGTRRVAVFDCDGTVIKGDIGEAMFYHQIEHFLFPGSPASVWPDHPRRTTLDELYERLKDLSPEHRTSDPKFAQFAGMLLDWYFGQIDAGKVAKACADIVRLFAGYSTETVRKIAADTFAAELHSPLTTRTLGLRKLPLGVRFIRESLDLLRELQKNGFDIWAVSGSSKWSVEPVFEFLGVNADHIIGIELISRDGLLTREEVIPVPIRKGKVDAMKAHLPSPPVFAASDSRNDIPMLLASTGLKVRVNSRGRDAADFFREAGGAPDEAWINIESPTILEQPPQ